MIIMSYWVIMSIMNNYEYCEKLWVLWVIVSILSKNEYHK